MHTNILLCVFIYYCYVRNLSHGNSYITDAQITNYFIYVVLIEDLQYKLYIIYIL